MSMKSALLLPLMMSGIVVGGTETSRPCKGYEDYKAPESFREPLKKKQQFTIKGQLIEAECRKDAIKIYNRLNKKP